MFEIKVDEQGRIVPIGRMDASRIDEARTVFEAVDTTTTVDMARLDYISSVGIGVLLAAQKRLGQSGQKLRLVNTSDPIKDVFRFSGLAQIFDIE